MKRKMHRFFIILCVFTISFCALVGCKEEKSAKAEIVAKTETLVVIKVIEVKGDATLLDAMHYLQGEGALQFEVVGGMLSSIEGKANPADWSACWMLYTSDAEMSNTQWGTVDYNEHTYGSAILGVDSLQVTVGEYYIWSFDSF